jgi:hypothetical protein
MLYLILGALLIVLSSAVYGPPLLSAAGAYFRLPASRQRLCPETGRFAMVQLNAARAARTLLTAGVAEIQVRGCTRWPERRGCAQGCIERTEDQGAANNSEREYSSMGGHWIG